MMAADKIFRVALPPGKMLPPLPAAGLQTDDEVEKLPGAVMVQSGLEPDALGFLAISKEPSTFAYVKATVHRNLYRIPLQ
jgi:hypothetical protein